MSKDLNTLLVELGKAHAAAEKATAEFKALEAVWKNIAGVKKAEAAKKAWSREKNALEKTVRAEVESLAEEGVDSPYVTLRHKGLVLKSGIPPQAIIALILDNVPGLAGQLLSLNMGAFLEARKDNPMVAAIFPDEYFKPAYGSTIHWSWLAKSPPTQDARSRYQLVSNRYKDLEEYVFIDTETTGLNVKSDQPVSIAVVDGKTGLVLFDKLVRPTVEISPGAEAVHGISQGKLDTEGHDYKDVSDELNALLDSKTVLAYNAPYDEAMLKNIAKATGVAAPNATSWQCVMRDYAIWEGTVADHGGYRFHRLADACKENEISIINQHTAAGDAMMMRNLVFDVFLSFDGIPF